MKRRTYLRSLAGGATGAGGVAGAGTTGLGGCLTTASSGFAPSDSESGGQENC